MPKSLLLSRPLCQGQGIGGDGGRSLSCNQWVTGLIPSIFVVVSLMPEERYGILASDRLILIWCLNSSPWCPKTLIASHIQHISINWLNYLLKIRSSSADTSKLSVCHSFRHHFHDHLYPVRQFLASPLYFTLFKVIIGTAVSYS